MLALVAAAAVIICFVGLALIYIMMTVGASNQWQNATDAGTLNIARQALTEINLQSEAVSPDTFADTANSKDCFNLENYNRMLAKALLISINENVMEQEQCQTEKSASNTEDSFQAARHIGQMLNAKLREDEQTKEFFAAVSNQNSVRMLGLAPRASLVGDVQVGFVDRGEPSNVKFKLDVLPEKFQVQQLQLMEDPKNESMRLLPGYVPVEVGGRNFIFVPQPCRPPHLITMRTFAQGDDDSSIRSKATGEATIVLPNAFAVNARAADDHSGKAVMSSAAAQADSLRDFFPLEIPHGFVRITNKKPVYVLKLHENDNGSWGKEIIPMPDCVNSCFNKTLKPKLDEDNAWFRLVGEEGHGNGPTVKMLKRYVQRMREMKNSFEENDMSPALRSTTVEEGTVAYTYRGKDGKVQLSQADDDKIDEQAPWLRKLIQANVRADGKLSQESTLVFPTQKMELVACSGCAVAAMIDTNYHYEFTPGTGQNNDLGDLMLGRIVVVHFLAPGKAPTIK
jgi:hypothetical protein